jgi:hypothetical protein
VRSTRLLSYFTVAVALALGACGGGGPSSPSGLGSGVTVRGTVLGMVSNTPAGVAAFAAADQGVITVTIQEDPSVKTQVGADGTFTLRGLPEGAFTLVFTDGAGRVVGTLVFDEVKPNQEITISVDVTASGVVLLEERRNGIGHGGLEIEGRIEEMSNVQLAADSELTIAGYTVVVRPGATAIRKGGRRLTVADLSEGDRVHVKGEWLPLAGGVSDQPVLAHEIILQQEADDVSDAPSGKITICHIPPGNPKNKKTKTIDASAWPAHQAHGDTMGPCPAS